MNEYLSVSRVSGLWAAGDCAAVPDGYETENLIAWAMWRSIYLMKLPRLAKKIRVMMDWALDLSFGREIEQVITLRDVQALSDRLARIQEQIKRRSEEQTSLATNLRSS